jgi:hypothetical protein
MQKMVENIGTKFEKYVDFNLQKSHASVCSGFLGQLGVLFSFFFAKKQLMSNNIGFSVVVFAINVVLLINVITILIR